MADTRRPKHPPFQIRYSTLITMWTGFTLCLFVSIWLHGEEERREENNFLHEASEHVIAFSSELNDISSTLALLSRRYTEVGAAGLEPFRFSTRVFLEKHPYIAAFICYSVTQASDHAFPTAPIREQEKTIRNRDIKEGDSPAADRNHRHLTFQFMEASTANKTQSRADLTRLAGHVEDTLSEASLSAAPHIFPLARHIGDERLFTLVMPIYKDSSKPSEIIGYMNAVFRIADLAEHTFVKSGYPLDAGVGVEVYDKSPALDKSPVFTQGVLPSGDELLKSKWRSVDHTFTGAGKELRMVISRPLKAFSLSHTGSWFVLFGGFVITILVAACFQILATRAKWLEDINETLTRNAAELERVGNDLRNSQSELRELSTHQEQVREDERKRIAREIHDDLGQNLLAMRIDLSLISKETGSAPSLAGQLEGLFVQLDQTIRSVRGIINDLRPSVLDLGLCAAVEWQIGQMNQRYKVAFEFVGPDNCCKACLDDERATAVFRIVQESMTNVVRHANAHSAQIRLVHAGGCLIVTISDDGVGSSANEKRRPRTFGLIGIRERITAMGGDFSMTSIPGQGTTMTLSIPTGSLKETSRCAAAPDENHYAI